MGINTYVTTTAIATSESEMGQRPAYVCLLQMLQFKSSSSELIRHVQVPWNLLDQRGANPKSPPPPGAPTVRYSVRTDDAIDCLADLGKPISECMYLPMREDWSDDIEYPESRFKVEFERA